MWWMLVRHVLARTVWYLWARLLLWLRGLLPTFPRVELPAPLPDTAGSEVGGIESITIDGKRWYFGFSFSHDLVNTPLIDDAEAMAAFASWPRSRLTRLGRVEPIRPMAPVR